MNKRTKALAISQKVKERVWERDGGRCVCRGGFRAMPNVHVISRAQGGMGVEENVVTLCLECHEQYDHSTKRWEIREKLVEYLSGIYPRWSVERVTYRKYAVG